MGRTKNVPIKFASYDYIPIQKRNNLKSRKSSKTKHLSHPVILPEDSNRENYLGKILLGRTNNVLPDTWKNCRAGFIINDDEFFIKLQFDADFIVLINVINDHKLVKGLFTSKIFAINFNSEGDNVFAHLFIAQFPLPMLSKSIGNLVQMVFAAVFSIGFDDIELNVKGKKKMVEKLNVLYKNVSQIRNNKVSPPQNYKKHPFLIPQLRTYQEQAVCWMKFRETQGEVLEILNPLYKPVNLESGKVIYYSKYLGHIVEEKPLVSNVGTGGILADEMGLGKTVEVLACILSYPKNDTDEVQVTDDSYIGGTPSISKQPRKYKRASLTVSSDNYVHKPKKLKVPNDWIKNSSKKSNTRIALEMWYENTLHKLSTKNSEKCDAAQVQCICGVLDEKDSIGCVDCGKYQHTFCMGYKNSYGIYRCPKCWTQQPLLESKATLIICPLALQTQWCDEIRNHISAGLNVLVYEGSKAVHIYPTKLKEYDLVLTTYNVLQAELRLCESEQRITLRRGTRYASPGCPLALINWWRLCLDEAQTVETPTAMISTMAKKLYAHHRWAVTGTPISRDISALYGLVDYLQIEPYNELVTWNYLLYYPYLSGNKEPMYNFLAQIMWRSSKSDVVSQINIPSQTVNEYFIEFSAVEKYYYQCEHELCTTFLLSKLRMYNASMLLNEFDKRSLEKIMKPLLILRQACNYPNVSRGRYLSTNKSVTSMKGLLDTMIEKNITDSDESLRIVVSSLNGLAGIYLLLQKPQEGIEQYRKVLQLAARFNAEDKNGVSVDKLQLIHSMYNLAEVIENHPPMHPTLRDDTLKQDCWALQEKYIGKFISQNVATYKETVQAVDTVVNLQQNFLLGAGEWYTTLIQWVLQTDLNEELHSRISKALENANSKKMNVRNMQSIHFLIASWDEDLNNCRETTINLLNKMYTCDPENDYVFEITERLVYEAMDCHLRPESDKKNKKSKKCLVCNVSKQMRKYESVIFDMTKSNEDDVDISNKGSWKPSSEELSLKALYHLGRVKGGDEESLKDGELFFRVLESQKKEFKQMRKFWTYLDQQICAHDEVNMCKVRLRLKDRNKQQPSTSVTDRILKELSSVLDNKLRFINFVEEHELEYQVSLLKNEERENMVILERNLGIYNYLNTLRLQQYAGKSPDPCPVCKNALQDQWAILPCGHCYCLECMHILLDKIYGRLTCCVCRQLQKVDDISYIKIGDTQNQNDSMKIKGNYSTKIEEIVKLVMKLRNDDPNVKILIFSMWVAILKVTNEALVTNEVSTELMIQTSMQKSLVKFKNNNVTTLLLPIHLGSKGLNLIEATHVILMEPLLNSADESQAVGRIHRMGQTKPTTVHKFIVKNTIEEKLHHSISQNANGWNKNKITLEQLKNLFVSSTENVTVDSSGDASQISTLSTDEDSDENEET
ncbi:hypothetical protein FQA39_LY02413 [Lamprigera yunnana]|nr:hypothetical protein FQA39_LY02413 [Lamprigera yunnana]